MKRQSWYKLGHQVCHSVRARQHSLRQLTPCTLKICYLTISSIYNTISTYGVVLQLFPTPFSANRAHNSSDRGFSASPICQGLETIQNPIHHEAQLRCLVALAEFWLDTFPDVLPMDYSCQNHQGSLKAIRPTMGPDGSCGLP